MFKKNRTLTGGFTPCRCRSPEYENPQTGNTALSKKRRGGQGGQAFVPSTSSLMLFIFRKNDDFSRAFSGNYPQFRQTCIKKG
jgi:hypothetical protein